MKKELSILTASFLDKQAVGFFLQAWHSLGKRGFACYKNGNVTISGPKQGDIIKQSLEMQGFCLDFVAEYNFQINILFLKNQKGFFLAEVISSEGESRVSLTFCRS